MERSGHRKSVQQIGSNVVYHCLLYFLSHFMITDLKEEHVHEFMEIWKNEYGVDLEFADAKEKAINILNFFDTVRKMKASSE